jgi:hypothetical protein
LTEAFLTEAFLTPTFLALAFLNDAFLVEALLIAGFMEVAGFLEVAGAFFAAARVTGARLIGERLTTADRPETFLGDVRFAEIVLALLFRTPTLDAGLFLTATVFATVWRGARAAAVAASAPLLSTATGNTSRPRSAMLTPRRSWLREALFWLAFFWITSIWIFTFHSCRR